MLSTVHVDQPASLPRLKASRGWLMQSDVQEHKVEETANALASGRGQHELVLESLNGSSATAQHSMQPAQQYTTMPSHQQPAAQLVSVSWSCLCTYLQTLLRNTLYA